MPRPSLPKFDCAKYAAFVARVLDAANMTAANDVVLSALMPSPELQVNREGDFVYQGRTIVAASAPYKVVASALLVECNNRTTQISRMLHAMSCLRCVPRPVEALDKLNSLLVVYTHIKQYLTSLKSNPSGE